MRIISGCVRGKKLVEFTGARVRPTSDRIREALFNILTSRLGTLNGCKVLDLFSGTGALALEALSRGAQSARLIDSHSESIKIIKKNIDACRMNDCTTVQQGELPAVLAKIESCGTYDLIFLDPPYDQDLAPVLLSRIDALGLLSSKGIIVVETEKGCNLAERIGSLAQTNQRCYGISTITLFERTPLPA